LVRAGSLGVGMGSLVRRVQFTGRSTYIISIPKDWARSVGITKGSKVFIEIMPDNSLRIRPEPRLAEVKLTKIIDLSSGLDVNTAMREIVGAYVAGFEVFKINFNGRTLDALKKLRDVMNSKLANLMVVEESQDSVTFKVVSSPKPMSVREFTSWISRLVSNMFSDLLRGIREGDVTALEAVWERDDLVDKAYIMATRQLTRVLMGEATLDSLGLGSQAEVIHYYHAFKTLERMADHLSSIAIEAKGLIERWGKIDSSLIKFMEEVSGAAKASFEALIKLDVETSRGIALQIEALKTKLMNISASITSVSKDPAYNSILISVGRLLGYSLDLAEIVFDITAVRSVAEVLYE